MINRSPLTVDCCAPSVLVWCTCWCTCGCCGCSGGHLLTAKLGAVRGCTWIGCDVQIFLRLMARVYELTRSGEDSSLAGCSGEPSCSAGWPDMLISTWTSTSSVTLPEQGSVILNTEARARIKCDGRRESGIRLAIGCVAAGEQIQIVVVVSSAGRLTQSTSCCVNLTARFSLSAD